MWADSPVACSLSALDLSVRLVEIADLGRAALLHVSSDEHRADLRFTAAQGVRERVQAIVDAESRCCAFLTMRVSALASTVVLTIDAPEGAELVLAELVDAFGGHPSDQP